MSNFKLSFGSLSNCWLAVISKLQVRERTGHPLPGLRKWSR